LRTLLLQQLLRGPLHLLLWLLVSICLLLGWPLLLLLLLLLLLNAGLLLKRWAVRPAKRSQASQRNYFKEML
jgi:hypothetical protein